MRGGRVALRAQHQPVGQAHVDDRERAISSAWSCCKVSSRSSAATSDPPAAARRCRCHVQVPAPLADATAATTCDCSAGRSVSASKSGAAAAGAPGPTTSGRWRNARHSGRRRSGRRGRSARIFPGSATPRTAAALAAADDGGGQAALDRRVLDPGQSLDPRPRGGDGKAEDRLALATPRAARSSGSGVFARPSIATACTRRPNTAVAEPSRSRRLVSVPPELFEWTGPANEQHEGKAEHAPAERTQEAAVAARQQLHRPGRSLMLLRGRRFTRDMRRSPPSTRTAAENSCRDAPLARAAARSG